MLEKEGNCSCLVLGQTVHSHSIFWSSVPLKVMRKEIIQNIQISFSAVAEYMEWNLEYADNTPNEI